MINQNCLAHNGKKKMSKYIKNKVLILKKLRKQTSFTKKELKAFGEFCRNEEHKRNKEEIKDLKKTLQIAIGEVARLRKKLGYDK